MNTINTLDLVGARSIPWRDTLPDGMSAIEVVFGRDDTQVGEVQVAVARSAGRPTKGMLEPAWKKRAAMVAMPVIVAAVHADGVWLYDGRDAALGPITVGLAERQLQAVLDEPDGIAAQKQIDAIKRALDSGGVGGYSNNFLFASYHLRVNVPKRGDWVAASTRGAELLTERGGSLIKALGFRAEPVSNAPGSALVLRAGSGSRRAIAVLLDESEQFDRKSAKYQLSPVAHGLEVAGREDVPWLIVLRQSTLRLYPGRDGVGVGQRGQSETFFELDLALLEPEAAGLLPLIFSADALERGGSADEILDGSGRYAADLGARLRDRVYVDVVPQIAVAIAERLPQLGHAVDAEGLKVAYALTLRVLFRLLFQAYAEDSELLPAGRNQWYDANSLQAFVEREKATDAAEFSDSATSIWRDLMQVWDAIFSGNRRWEVPAYGGSLFDPDTEEGALLRRLELPDSVLGPTLQAMLVETTEDGIRGAVDFRSLQVREFGTIYEGLLESSLSVAVGDLTVDRSAAFVPAKETDEIVVPAGRPYFHSASGERKATGSYFTPKIVVDHLIDRSVAPALDAHLAKVRALVEEGKDREAAALFWDFRVADLAMGSAHFLVAAVDKIERGMRDFLTVTPVPGVRAELARLADTAREALGEDVEAAEAITEAQLLRRQVARRCVYGLDINPLAVELSRLAIWIHTFVPGLPMSSLDHGLVLGNSLTGVGTVDEALDALDVGPILEPLIREPLSNARKLLLDFANASEADRSEVAAGEKLLSTARQVAAPARAIFDTAVAKRLGLVVGEAWDPDQFQELAARPNVREALDSLQSAHLPFLFPEVFLRARAGFDAVIGNPPWDKVRHEPQQFWVVRDPGLNALSADARKARIEWLRASRPLDRQIELESVSAAEMLIKYCSSAYKYQASQHYDFAKLFAERNLAIVRDGGELALVLPQALLVLGGWRPIREAMIVDHRVDLIPLRNTGGWAFPNVDGRMTIALVICGPGAGVSVSAALSSAQQLAELDPSDSLRMKLADLRALSEELNIPWFENAEDPAIFAQLSGSPRLGDGRGWIHGHADSTRWDFSASGKHAELASPSMTDAHAWRVTMTRHVGAYVMTPTDAGKWIPEPRKLAELGAGIVEVNGRVLVGPSHPPIVHRFPTNNDNSRTLVAAALPASGWLFSKGYAHGIKVPEDSSTRDILALLGYLNCVAADWWARRFVDRHLGKRIIEGLPLPDWDESTRQEVADLVSVILRAGGVTKIAGDRPIGEVMEVVPTSAVEAKINALAFHGLEVGTDEAAAMFDDFAQTKAGLPAELRIAILNEMASRGDRRDR